MALLDQAYDNSWATTVTFEDNPGFGETKKNRDPVEWMFSHKRGLLRVAAVVLGLLIAGLATVLIGDAPTDVGMGGLDGCVVSMTGEPIEAAIEISGQTATTQRDGCFFFASLPAGEANLAVHLKEGSVVQYQVIINAGQATMLGPITVSQ